MKQSIKTGFSFGTVSGVITTLGLLVGLISSNADRGIIIGGILSIAFADAFSDALGIHISEESKEGSTKKNTWLSTFWTYSTKLITALTFLIPVIFFPTTVALIIAIVWGLLILALSSYLTLPKENRVAMTFEHLFIGTIVIIVAFIIGEYISRAF